MAPPSRNKQQQQAPRVADCKRKKTLKKKAHELETLCGIPVCLLYVDNDDNFLTYPEEPEKVNDILMRYKAVTEKNPHAGNHLQVIANNRTVSENLAEEEEEEDDDDDDDDEEEEEEEDEEEEENRKAEEEEEEEEAILEELQIEGWNEDRLDYLPEEALIDVMKSLDDKLKVVNERLRMTKRAGAVKASRSSRRKKKQSTRLGTSCSSNTSGSGTGNSN